MNIRLEQLQKGTLVKINPQSDRTRTILVEGLIQEVLTKSPSHPHGLLVRLQSGETGRVKELINRIEVKEETELDELASVERQIEDIIANGESHFSEFKSSCLWSQDLSKEAILARNISQYGTQTSRIIIAKSIAGFLNADGGSLVIGVKEVKDKDEVEVIGINSEVPKLKDKTLDGYRRMLLDSVILPYFPSFVFNRINDHLKISFHDLGDATVCLVNVSKSKRRVFLGLSKKDVFMVRIDASTRQVIGEDLVEYCLERFEQS
jgi:uncharacterized repeat protein (TIGR03833 family)